MNQFKGCSVNNSQWNVEINPECGSRLFITAEGKVRPCMWISERSPEKNIFDDDINYDMNHTSLDDIINLHLKKFTDNIKENPYNGLKICFYECTS